MSFCDITNMIINNNLLNLGVSYHIIIIHGFIKAIIFIYIIFVFIDLCIDLNMIEWATFKVVK